MTGVRRIIRQMVQEAKNLKTLLEESKTYDKTTHSIHKKEYFYIFLNYFGVKIPPETIFNNDKEFLTCCTKAIRIRDEAIPGPECKVLEEIVSKMDDMKSSEDVTKYGQEFFKSTNFQSKFWGGRLTIMELYFQCIRFRGVAGSATDC